MVTRERAGEIAAELERILAARRAGKSADWLAALEVIAEELRAAAAEERTTEPSVSPGYGLPGGGGWRRVTFSCACGVASRQDVQDNGLAEDEDNHVTCPGCGARWALEREKTWCVFPLNADGAPVYPGEEQQAAEEKEPKKEEAP